jgi:3',5'-cyclic AMP phosphodiesterase CpdA
MKANPPQADIYRIAHLSDLHLTGVNQDFGCCLALVEDATAHGAEHLIISGDLVECGQMKVLKDFVAALKDRGWAGSNRLTIVPGNHDIFPASTRVLPVLRRPTSIYHDFAAITRGSRTGKGFRSLLRGAAYPFGKLLNDQVVLVGLDTTRNGERNPQNWAGGELSEEQMAATEEFFTQWSHVPHRVIVMHHHPWREGFDTHSIERIIGRVEQNFVKPSPEEVFAWIKSSNATLVLCGHVHQQLGIEKRSFGKRRFILRAGTAGGVDEGRGSDKLRIYHLLDLKPGGEVTVLARKFMENNCNKIE